MLVVVSPAKKMDMNAVDGAGASQPSFAEEAVELAKVARKLSVPDLQKLMSISHSLASLNVERFESFGSMDKKSAALAFAGDTYQGLEAWSFDPDEMSYAQEHLRILSGLYGILRPLDQIEPYRLEMGSRLKTQRGKTLYDYWGDKIALALNAQAKTVKTSILVNCASQEYFGAVDTTALDLKVITPQFMEMKDGTPKIVSFFAKKARGAMARYIVQTRPSDEASLLDFKTGGYRYEPDLSEPNKPVFLRDQVSD